MLETTLPLDQWGSANTYQAFTSWKWRWNEQQWTMTSGVHVLFYDLNAALSVEISEWPCAIKRQLIGRSPSGPECIQRPRL
ncbi:MAG: hypothetical protein R2818_01795 [Flavobacteriales bacterium]